MIKEEKNINRSALTESYMLILNCTMNLIVHSLHNINLNMDTLLY